MKVKRLIEELLTMPQDAEVILQKDSEGNGYSPLYCIDHDAIYVPDSKYSGDVYYTNWTAEEACMEQAEWEEFKKQPRCVVLCPTN